MRSVALVLAACGPMYAQPGAQQQPANQPNQTNGDPWAGNAPASQSRPSLPPAEEWGNPPPDNQPSHGSWGNPPPANEPPASDAWGNQSQPASSPPSTSHAGTIAQRFVDAHNKARAKHCAKPLSWSPKLASYAQKWADTLKAKGCAFGHSGGPYGENLGAGTEGVLDPEATVAMWYDEVKLYKFPDGGFSMQTGHFTQLVWRGTTQVGCGHSQCKGNDIWVCEYDPPGNYDGEYRTNVLPAGCK